MIAPNEQLAGKSRLRVPYLITRDEAEMALNELAQAENNRRKLIATMDAAILKIKDAHAPGIAQCDEFIESRAMALGVWAEQHPQEFPKDKKSIEFAAGRMGFRISPPTLALLNRSFNWGKVLMALTKKKWRKLIRVKTEVDKEAVLARCGTLEKPTAFQVSILPGLGLKVVQDEKFFLETSRARCWPTNSGLHPGLDRTFSAVELNMIPTSAITDHTRMLFMRKLADNVRLPNGLMVTPWESDFIASFARDSRPSLWFTGPRRVSADKLRQKYGSEPEIAMPYPPAESSPAKLPEADPDGCQFITREDGWQQPCNAPAEQVRQNGFRYCAAHAEAVQRDLQRRGKPTMHLYPFKP